MKRPIYYQSLEDIPGVRHQHPHAVNVIHDAFGPANGMPFVSVVDRLPQLATPTSVHSHQGWNELIVMLSGKVILWCGSSATDLEPYVLEPTSMFLIPSDACHVFLNGGSPARWMIMFTPASDSSQAASREEISRDHTRRSISISVEMVQKLATSMATLASPVAE